VTFNGSWFAVSDGDNVYVIEFGELDLSEPRRLEHLEGSVSNLACDPLGRFVAARYENGETRLSDLEGASPPTVMQGPSVATTVRFTPDGSFLEAMKRDETGAATWVWSLADGVPTLVRRMDLGKYVGTGSWILNPVERQIVSVANPDPKIRLWPLSAPADAAPVILQQGDVGALRQLAIHPQGHWLASSGTNGLTFWPIARPYPTVLDRYEERVGNLVFGPEGQWLATSTIDLPGTVRLWQLESDELPPARVLHEARTHAYGLAASPDGEHILLGDHSSTVELLSASGGEPVALPGVVDACWGVAISSDGRFAAASGRNEDMVTALIRVWELASHEQVAVKDLGGIEYAGFLRFTEDGHILCSNSAGLLRWDLETGDSETLVEVPVDRFAISSDDTRGLFLHVNSSVGRVPAIGRAVVLDLGNGSTSSLVSHGDRVTAVAMDAGGSTAVTGDANGVIRVGPVTGEEPHLLLGNPDEIWDLAVDPKGRWIASASGPGIRLWPMPDLSKPPLHTLPREELIAKLKTLTNLRVVRDEESATGWTLTHDPFPGWETVPTW
jgi:WD40 repeat protein